MPDTIHVPLMAPMSKRMMMAGVQLAIFLVISFSSCSHLNFLVNSPIITDTADATNSDT